MNISVKIGTSVFPNPVTVASGTFGHSEEFYHLKEVRGLGALVPKTVTLKARTGNPPPRILETPSGMLNAIGIENPGIDVFIEKKLPALQRTGVPVIVSIMGHTPVEFVKITDRLNRAEGVAAVELNLSCPNLGKKALVAQDARATFRTVQKVKTVSRFPVIAKLSPNVTDIAPIARSAEDAGADGISLINTLAGMAIDIRTAKPVLGNVTGGLSGPAIRPVAVYMVYRTAQAVKIPLIAMGGIRNSDDALEFVLAGATMVAVGTMNYVNPRAPLDVLDGIKAYMRSKRVKNFEDLVGMSAGEGA